MPKLKSAETVADFRDRLCDAAERLFAEHGPDAVTMRQLAAEVGVSPMTPYGYFKDKDAILAAVRARAFARHAQALEVAFEAAPPNDPEARSEAVGRAYVRFALEHPEAYKLMFDTKQPNADHYPELVAASERSRATMTRHLSGTALKGDPQRVGHLFWAALHGPLMLHFAGMLPSPQAAVDLIGGLTQAVWASSAREPID